MLPFHRRVQAADYREGAQLTEVPMDALRKALNPAAEETLDPDDWTAVQALSHQIVDEAISCH